MANKGTKAFFDAKLPNAADLSIVASKRAGAPVNASLQTLAPTNKPAKLPNTSPSHTVITPAGTPYLAAPSAAVPDTSSVACHPDDYVSANVRKYMSRDCLSRSQALCKVYRKSDLQTWNLFAGEAGRCHSITDWVLRAPAKLALWFSGAVSAALAACEKTVCHSDDLVRVNFGCERKMRLPCSGRYQVMYCGGKKPEELCTGQYELPSYCEGGSYHDLRMPLYRVSKLADCVKKESPIAEVVMRCKRSRRCDDKACDHRACNRMRVCGVHLLNHLRPDPARLLDPSKVCTTRVPCRTGVLDYSPNYCTEYETAEARLSASPHQRLRECHDAIGAVIKERIRGSKFRIVGHIGETQVCNLANDNSSSFYRLGGVTEPVFIMTVLRHIQSCAPRDVELDVRNPDLTEALLRQSGAINVLEGLRQCYKGSSLPTVHDLISHTSGLPLNLTLEIASLQKIVAESVGRLNTEAAEIEARFGEALCITAPMFAPSTCYSYSYVGLEVLRYMLPDWRTNDCTELLKTCQDVGLASADLCSNKIGCHEDSSSVDRHLGSTGQIFMHATGLSARCEELANFLAATRTKHSWTNAGDSSYSFAPRLISPAVSVMREQGLSWGYGFCHVSLLRQSKAYGDYGLRALLRVGETPGHTVIACMVPACGLSFALTCTAPLVQLCGSACDANTACEDMSVMGLVSSLVGAILDKMSDIPSVRTQVATNWNRTLNEQLSCVPAPLPNFSSQVLHCRNSYALNTCELADLESYLASPLVSVLDGVRCSLSVTKNLVDSTVGGVSRKLFGYTIDVRSPFGDCSSYPIAYDQRRNCFRTVCRNTGLLTEVVEMSTVKASCGMSATEEPCVSFGGRMYVSERLYNLLRRTYAPSQEESVQDQIARRVSLSDAPIADGNVVDALAKIGHAVSAQSAMSLHIPADVQHVNARGGFGAGVAVGALGTLGAAAILSPRYAYAPPVVWDPYYDPPVYPYPRYWRRPYRRVYPYW